MPKIKKAVEPIAKIVGLEFLFFGQISDVVVTKMVETALEKVERAEKQNIVVTLLRALAYSRC